MAKLNPEILKYKTNKASYLLCVLALTCICVAFIMVYVAKTLVSDYRIGIDILFNIVSMMIIFLAAEKVKAYKKVWAHTLIVIAVIEVIRIFLVPLYFFNIDQLTAMQFISIVILLIVSALSLGGSAFVCYKKIEILNKLDEPKA